MKTALGVIGAAAAASVCCTGPVVFTSLGAGALSAASVKLEVYRPWFLGVTFVLLGAAFYGACRPGASEPCAADEDDREVRLQGRSAEHAHQQNTDAGG